MRITAPRPDQRVPLDEIDLYDPERFRSSAQHVVWQTLRAEAPVWWQSATNGTGFWSVTRYADCLKVLKDHKTFSSQHGTILASVGVGDSAGGLTITLTDPPRHGEIRVPAMRTLAPKIVQQRAERIREQVRKVVAPCLEGGAHDFARLMRRLPLAVVGEVMGIPERYWDDIARWTTASVAPADPDFATGSSVAETLRYAHHELFACFSELIRHRRVHPADDLITILVNIRPDGARMEDSRVLLNCYSFVLGANSTTPHVASHTLLALTERREAWRAVVDDPSLVPALVEEGARWASPTHHLTRRANDDTEIGGTAIARGDWVCAWVASANRDESVFDDPYTFDVRRSPNPHLAFGMGAHYCIGAPSSRLALAMLFEELAGRIDSFELAGEPVHLYSNWINGLTRLPVVFGTRRARGRA